MFTKSMEELNTIAQTQAIGFQVFHLSHRVQRSVGKIQTSSLLNVAKHIVGVHTQSYPITDVKTQTTIYLCESTLATIPLREIVIGVDGVNQRKIISYCRIWIYAQ